MNKLVSVLAVSSSQPQSASQLSQLSSLFPAAAQSSLPSQHQGSSPPQGTTQPTLDDIASQLGEEERALLKQLLKSEALRRRGGPPP